MTAQSVRVPNASTTLRPGAGKRKLLWSCAGAVIAAAAIQPQEAKAAVPSGAFQGSIMGEPSNVSRGSMTSTTETITISAPKATIDWSAWQADFLPTGHVATFLGSGVSDFTVLNRINADGQRIELNGTVLGRLQGMGSTPAGKIWFYSPGGILVGGTAVFDVGGLVLTANDPVDFDESTNGFGDFNANIESTAAVIVAEGANIAANPANSYVALIAPRVEQHGTVTVNGAAAYAAGQEVTMTVNQGLFDIAIDVGTDDPNGIVHSGVTTGPVESGAGDHHRIYMVAVPKNQALTMLLGGTVGFGSSVATTAINDRGQVILSAGHDVDEGVPGGDNVVPNPTFTLSSGSPASIDMDGLYYGTSLNMVASEVARIDGEIVAPSITVTSADLEVGEDGTLGAFGITELITLNAISYGNPVIIGEPDEFAGQFAEGIQYHLGDEDGEIATEALVLNARGDSGDPVDINIYDAEIDGSLHEDDGLHSITLNTQGTVRVLGTVDYHDVAPTDHLTISAGQRIEVITPDGSIRISGPNGNLSGILTLQSANIVAAESALAAQLAQNSSFTGRDAALATNNGAVNAGGYLQAGGIQLLAGSNIFIQNTGTATEFAGLTVGGGGLLVGRYQPVTNPNGTQGFSFVGTLTTANDVLQFNFTVSAESQITLRTYSYAGGTNAAGQQIASGGFDPILALFNAAGNLINQNDDGGANVPADPNTGAHFDTFLQSLLPAGTYTVTVMAYSNFANGPNLSDGFQNDGDFYDRSPHFAFDVLGANTASGPGEVGPLTVVAFGRAQNANGSVTTGSTFFNQVDFGIGGQDGVEYVEGSSFNGCIIGAACGSPPPPPPPPNEPSSGPESILGPVGLMDSPMAGDFGGSDNSDEPGEDGEEESAESIAASLGLISTGGLNAEQLVDDPVTSGSDSGQWDGPLDLNPGE